MHAYLSINYLKKVKGSIFCISVLIYFPIANCIFVCDIISFICIKLSAHRFNNFPSNQKKKRKEKEVLFFNALESPYFIVFVFAVVYPFSLLNIKLLTMLSRNERSLLPHDYSSRWWSRCILVLSTPYEETGIYKNFFIHTTCFIILMA